MKVIQIVTQMEAAGAQKVAYLLHEGLCTRVQQSELWFLYTKRAAYADFDGVSSLFDRPPNALDYVTIAARLYHRLRVSKPDVLITHTHYSNVMGQVIAKAAKVPRRIAVHHNPVATYPNVVRLVDRVLGQLGTYTDVVAISKTVADTLQPYPAPYLQRVKTINNGLSFSQDAPKTDVRARWDIPPGKPLLVNVGRLSRQKNHALLLQAVREVPDAHLAIVGDGELRDELIALARTLRVSDRVHFTGEVAPEEVAAFLEASSVFVFPSLWEGLPLAAIEALHAGAAIVSSDIPATREVFQNAAMIVPVGDASSWAAAIVRILKDPVLANTLRSRAKQRATFFSAKTMINNYCQLIANDPVHF